MEVWKRNLWICCAASFIVSVGMSQMAPMLPLYIAELGVHDVDEIERWAGIIYGANFISLAIFSPIWGRLSDRYGRKPMALRASLWLGIIMIGMGLAQNVYQLTALRLAQGALSGFQASVIPLVAQEAPDERSGWALGIFFTAQVSGTLLGPIVGGFLAEMTGYRHTFFIIGICCFLGFLSLFKVHETVRSQAREQAAALSLGDTFRLLPSRQLIIGLFGTTLVMQFATMSIQPIITVYITQLVTSMDHIALIAGIVFSCAGFASMLAASRLGKLADRVGSHKVLLASLIIAGLSVLPQGLVRTPVELGILRFFFGIGVAGLLPSVNNLIRQYTPPACLGRIYGFNQSAQFLGMFAGASLGGQIAAAIGIANVFFITAAVLLVNAVWCRGMVYAAIQSEHLRT
jgi:DHA1 family multidrug resistance protein-like MFS transporter